MKKKQLVREITERAFEYRKGDGRWMKLASCKADTKKVFYRDKSVIILRSYSTIVGVYDVMDNTLYVFNSYSATTWKHVYRFCKDFKVGEMIKLFHDSTNECAVFFDEKGCRYASMEPTSWEALISEDYETLITMWSDIPTME